jgi:hypothetical protein
MAKWASSSVGSLGGIAYVTMELYLYGPITARATLLGVMNEERPLSGAFQ